MKKIEYTVKEGNEKVIYEATFDSSNLNNIRKDIIENCGLRNHISGDTDYPGLGLDFDLIRNYKKKLTGDVQEYDTEIRDIYTEEYDLIEEPKLAGLLKDFIRYGDIKLIDYIYGNEVHKDSKNTIEYFQNERVDLIKQAISILEKGKYDETINFSSLKSIIANIESISKNIDANKKANLKDETSYIDLIKSEITINEVARENIGTIEKAKRFIRLDRGN